MLIPILLSLAGIIFLALPFLTRFSGKINMSGRQRMLLIGFGLLLFVIGISLIFLPDGINGLSGLTEANAPTILGVTVRADQEAGGLVYHQEINFYDEDGNTNLVERELIDLSDASQRQFVLVQNGPVDAPPEVQKIRATVTEPWRCEGHVYVATVKVALVDRDGNRSEPVRYRIDCK